MGQCVSDQPKFITSETAPHPSDHPSISDVSQDNTGSGDLNNGSVIPEVSPMLNKSEITSDLYNSVPQPIFPKRTSRKSSISSLLPKVKGPFGKRKNHEQRNLSATFNMAAVDFKVALLDINTATEEQLMTLSGITRNLAHEIIEHRNAIGGFKKVEDLALVSGVGAKKLQDVRCEIFVGKKLSSRSPSVTTDASCGSLVCNGDATSVAPSPKPSVATRRRRRYPVDVNTASIFQLMTVDGITQEIAAHIVHYRERKGPFKTLYDLRKVERLNARTISAMTPYLTVESTPNGYQVQNGSLRSHRRTASLPSGPLLSTCDSSQQSVTGILNPSPIFPTVSQFEKALEEAANDISPNIVEEHENEGDPPEPGENSIRLLTWNLDGLTIEKARNPGVIEVVTKILTRYYINIAVIQGISDPLALSELCTEINKQSEIHAPYMYTSVENGIGYLHVVVLQFRSWSGIPNWQIQLANMENNNVGFALAVCSFKQSSTENAVAIQTEVSQLVNTILDLSPTERVFCVVDFSYRDHSQYVEEFQNLGYRPTVGRNESTSYCADKLDVKKEIHSNILVSRYAQKALTGQWGVIRNGLTHILIPNGWSWNGPASLYCPIWLELTTSNVE